MELKQKFVLREIAGDNVLIPITESGDKFQGIITLNETSVFIWKFIEQGKEKNEIVKEMVKEYNVSEEIACKDVEKMCDNLMKLGII